MDAKLREDEIRFIENLERKTNAQIESAIRCTWNLRIGDYFKKFGVYVLNNRRSGLGDATIAKVAREFGA